MSKAFKKFLLAAVIILVAGVLVWVIGMSVLGWDFMRLDSNEYTQKSFAAEGVVEKVEVDVDSFPVTVVHGDSVTLEYYEAENSTVTVGCEDGVLRVHEDYDYNPFKTGLFNFGRVTHKYVLTVTDGVELKLDVTNSVVEFDGLSFDELKIDSTNIKLSFANCEVKKLDVHSTNATVTITNGTFGDMNIDSTNLGLKMDNVTASNVIVRSTNATVNLRSATLDSFKLDGTNTTVTTTDGQIKSVWIDGTNVDCKARHLSVDTLYIDGTNLNANVSVVGSAQEFSVITHGKNMPSERQGSTDKSITLRGTNNSVSLEFSE